MFNTTENATTLVKRLRPFGLPRPRNWCLPQLLQPSLLNHMASPPSDFLSSGQTPWSFGSMIQACFLPQFRPGNGKVDLGMGQIKPSGDGRFWSMFPFTRVPFWVYLFLTHTHLLKPKDKMDQGKPKVKRWIRFGQVRSLFMGHFAFLSRAWACCCG